MNRFAQRREKLISALRAARVEALLVTNFTNVTYLTGFTGDDSYLVVGKGVCVLVSDGRYRTQIAEECPDLDAHIRVPGELMAKAIGKVVKKAKLGQLGFESASITVAERDRIAEELPRSELVAVASAVEDLRQCKDSQEVSEIREAIRIAQKAFDIFRACLSAEMTEKQAADDLEQSMRRLGATSASFPPIVAVGDRAALPHARPTQRRIGEAGFVLVDWGANGRLYKSDLTRVLATDKISPKLERVYGVVLRAQLRGIEAIGPGVVARDVDAAARGVIEEAGFGRYFDHGLGHGVGLNIHEAPRLRAESDVVLRPGMVITVEPGIYLPGWGGVRIEDDVLVTRDGCEVLTSTPKQLEQMVVAL